MAAIERGLVNSRCGDGPEDIRPKFGSGDVSSEPKSPPPTKLICHRLWGAKLCPRCITSHTCEPEYKPTVKIGSFRVPDFMEAFVEKMIGSYLDNTNSVLVTDLPCYVRSNSVLTEFCCPYGSVTSADVAIDQESGYTGCFGFVSFATRDDAQNAINNLNGVQWLTPKTTSKY